jgi:hypothetical protein
LAGWASGDGARLDSLLRLVAVDVELALSPWSADGFSRQLSAASAISELT